MNRCRWRTASRVFGTQRPRWIAAASVLLVGLVMTMHMSGRAGSAHADAGPESDSNPVLIARGAYLAKAADCAGCHTAAPVPTRPGAVPKLTVPFAGGLGMSSPFGTIYSSNITPDPVYGIGRYSYDDFAQALRKGVAPGGKRLYPAMPFPSFAKIDDDDLHALYAYFMRFRSASAGR
jgi:mono/diheme cytochrome c family protein